MKKPVFTLAVLFISGMTVLAQEAINGTMPDWAMGECEVIGGIREPVILGSVASDGNFSIPLKADYLTEVKMRMEASQKEATSGFTSSLLNLDRAFGCSSGDVEFENANQPVSGISTLGMFALGNMEEQKLYGYLMTASSDDFAVGIRNMMSFEFKPGYFVDWYFVEEAGSIKGSCAMEGYARNGEEMYTNTQQYDLEFQPGWNIVKYEIETVFEDRDGKTYPEKERYTTLDKVPAEIKYVFIPDER